MKLNLSATLILFMIAFQSECIAQKIPSGKYIGAEPMKGYVDPGNPKYKWYHLSKLSINNDSVFLSQSPISICKKDTMYSASDGGFYEYRGTIKKEADHFIAEMKMKSCDYCAIRSTDKITLMDQNDSVIAVLPDTIFIAKKKVKAKRIKDRSQETMIIKTTSDTSVLSVNGITYRLMK